MGLFAYSGYFKQLSTAAEYEVAYKINVYIVFSKNIKLPFQDHHIVISF